MSSPPNVPGRFDVKKRVFSSFERTGTLSSHSVLIGGPIFAGSDHSERFPPRLWASVIKVAENIQKTIAARAMIVRIAFSSERISRKIPDFDPKCIETRLRFFSEISPAQQIKHFLCRTGTPASDNKIIYKLCYA